MIFQFLNREIGHSPARLFRHAFSGRVAPAFGLAIARPGSVADAFPCTVLPRPRVYGTDRPARFERAAAVVSSEVDFSGSLALRGYAQPTQVFSGQAIG